MPRPIVIHQHETVNTVKSTDSLDILHFATTNEGKLREIKRILKRDNIVGIKLDIEEVQSLDPYHVIKAKARAAWEANGYNPVFVEDTFIEIYALNKRPGTFTKYFIEDPEIRRKICTEWVTGGDRRIVARVFYGMYDGTETHVYEGLTGGTLPDEPRGTNGFGWDDMFIPDGQPQGKKRTFAEMNGDEKDTYSPRRKALESLQKDPPRMGSFVWKLPEPYAQELERPQYNILAKNPTALKFAYALECLGNKNKPNALFEAPYYEPVRKENVGTYYTRYSSSNNSASLGIIITDIDRAHIKLYKNAEPVLWQMGPERRKLALAQRAAYFIKNTEEDLIDIIDKIEKGQITIPQRSNRRHRAIDEVLGIHYDHERKTYSQPTRTAALKEIGYRKQSSPKLLSRVRISESGLFNKIGKYPRRLIGLGSMPPVSGSRDVIVTAAVGHMVSFVTRNSIFASNVDRQIELIQSARKAIHSLKLSSKLEKKIQRNIGVSVGITNPKDELRQLQRLYTEAGIRLFRIYTIGSDPRMVETAYQIRKTFGDEVEIFAGTVADIKQAEQLIDNNIKVDALVYGHGGGRQCISAINGMAITTLEELYEITLNKKFNNTSLIVEGGVGRSIGSAMPLVDAVLYNQQLIHATIEAGDLFIERRDGICQPYHGEASPPTQLVEAANPRLRGRRLSLSGRTNTPEGRPGYMLYEEKSNSMSFWISEFLGYAARMMADMGVENFAEFRELLQDKNREFLRVVSSEASYIADAYKQGR